MTEASSPPASEQSGAQQAQQKAQETAKQAQGMVREQINDRSTQAGEQISSTADDLRSVGDELRNQGKDTPAKLADNAAEKTERVGSYLAEADADRLLSDIEDFGRRQPWLVLAGGVALGVVGARFLKASSSSRYRTRSELEQRTRVLPATPQQPPAPPVESATPVIEPTPPVTAGTTP